MIDGSPLKKILVEKDLSVHLVAQAIGFSDVQVNNIVRGKDFSEKGISRLCEIFHCQPCDILEWRDTETKGHWVFVTGDENANA